VSEDDSNLMIRRDTVNIYIHKKCRWASAAATGRARKRDHGSGAATTSPSGLVADDQEEALHLVEHRLPVGRHHLSLGDDVMNHRDHLFPLHDQVDAKVTPTEVTAYASSS
jgi:hypothetical protein